MDMFACLSEQGINHGSLPIIFDLHTRPGIVLLSPRRLFIAPFLHCLKTPTRAGALKLEPPAGYPLVYGFRGVPDGEDSRVAVTHQSLPE